MLNVNITGQILGMVAVLTYAFVIVNATLNVNVLANDGSIKLV
jgi:hypothetical protein